MQVGYTWAMLTEYQLATAAHDLRNAALVIKHAGHYQGALCDPAKGSVCAVGAIDLATYRTLNTALPPAFAEAGIRPKQGFFYNLGYTETWGEAGHNRAESAIVCLAEFIPPELCDECPEHMHCECQSPYCDAHSEPWKIVTHYNDTHCVNDDLAINMMRLAADKAEARAREKRRELVPA